MFLTCGLHKRSTNCFFSVTSTESRNSQCRNFSISPLSSEKFDFSIELFRVSRSGQSQHLLHNWKKSDPFILNTVQGFQTPFLSKSSQGCVSACDANEFRINNFSTSGNRGNAEKRGNKAGAFFPETVSKSHIFSSKEKFRADTSIEFEKVEPEHTFCTSQDGIGFFLLKELLREYDYVGKLGLKDAYFSVPLNPGSQKFIRFTGNGQIY